MTLTDNDWKECETLIRAMLSPEQLQILDVYPVWELNPPQREECDTPLDYARATLEYTRRVLDRGSNTPVRDEAKPRSL